jgi:hypothetical protein
MIKKVLILVEGPTEETFIRDTLAPYLTTLGIYIRTYGKVKNDILRLLTDTSAAAITTFFDYYGLPTDFLGYNQCLAITQCHDRITLLENAFSENINDRRFIPYIQLHEFEALMFSSPREIAKVFPASNKECELQSIAAQFKTPEEINNSPVTAPSKRLLKLFRDYSKVIHGPLVIKRIGLDKIR